MEYRDILFAFTMLGQWLDCVTTIYHVTKAGPGQEANPIARWAIKRFGLRNAAIGKILLGAYGAKSGSALVCGITWFPVVNNMMLIVQDMMVGWQKPTGKGWKWTKLKLRIS